MTALEFTPTTWINKIDTGTKVPINKDQLNRIETAVEAVVTAVNGAVKDAAINGSDHLILTLQDGTTIDAGVVGGGGTDPGTGADPAYVQSASLTEDTAATTQVLAFDTANGTGNLLVAFGSYDTSTVTTSPTLADSAGNTWTKILELNDTSAQQGLALYCAPNSIAGANTVTATYGDSRLARRLAVLEYSGIAITDPVDVFNSAAGITAGGVPETVSSPTITTTVDGDLVLGFLEQYSHNSGVTAGSGFTIREQFSGDFNDESNAADTLQTTAGDIAAAFVYDDVAVGIRYTAAVVAFKRSGTGGGTPTFTGDASDIVSGIFAEARIPDLSDTYATVGYVNTVKPLALAVGDPLPGGLLDGTLVIRY